LALFPKVPKIASESTENLHFRHPTVVWCPSPGNHSEYPRKPYIARN